MKKYLIILLALLLCLPSCVQVKPKEPEDSTAGESLGEPEALEMMRYAPSGWGMEYKTVERGNELIRLLEALEETGETAPELSNKNFDQSGSDIPEEIERGTFWLSFGGKLYRADATFESICLVTKHYGEGKLLAIPDELAVKLHRTWYHYPYDSYSGKYKAGDSAPELTHVYEADSNISIEIKEIELFEGYDAVNRITLTVTAKSDCEERITLQSYQSDDNLGMGDAKELSLKAGKAQTVTLEFTGFTYGYWIMIKADNTKIEIGIGH